MRPSTRYFCSCLDHRYLIRWLALYRSLRRHCGSVRFAALCLDPISSAALVRLGLEDVELLTLEKLERWDPELLEAKKNQSSYEYFLACRPSLILWCLDRVKAGEDVTYADSDLYFFEDPSPIYEEMSGHSIAITRHRFSPAVFGGERTGRYNAGWMALRNDPDARACLRRWREQCIAMRFRTPGEERFAKQRCLDAWPERFKSLVEIRHEGANVAPWNVANYVLDRSSGRMRVDRSPLIFFHFSGLREIRPWLYDVNLVDYRLRLAGPLLSGVYRPYLRTLLDVRRELSGISAAGPVASTVRTDAPLSRRRRIKNMMRGILARQYVLARPGVLWAI